MGTMTKGQTITVDGKQYVVKKVRCIPADETHWPRIQITLKEVKITEADKQKE